MAEDDEDSEGLVQTTKTKAQLEAMRGAMAKAAQKEYDDWEMAEDGTNWKVGSGGICHLIADALLDVLRDFEAVSVSSDHEVHVWVAVLLVDGVYMVDIPYRLYETGGGYNWKKIPDVTFEASDIIVKQIALVGDWPSYSEY